MGSKFLRLPTWRAAIFLVILFLEILDLISDWIFYVEVRDATWGLVYGPVQPEVVVAIFAFTVVGTLTFFVESANQFALWLGAEDMESGWATGSDYVTAVVMWLEDVPQVALSLYVAGCREEPISYFQLTKAGVVLAAAFVRLLATCIKHARGCCLEHRLVKVALVLGLLTEAVCAVGIFTVTNTERGETGNIAFRVPSNLVREELNDERYFAGSAIFLHHRGLFDRGGLDGSNPAGGLKVNWLRVAPIDDIREEEKEPVHFRYDYHNDAGGNGSDSFPLAVWRKKGQSPWTLSGSYHIFLANGTALQYHCGDNPGRCAWSGSRNDSANSVFLTFKFTPPALILSNRVFGHITFNAKIRKNNACRDLPKVVDKIEDEDGGQEDVLTLHFYLTGSQIDYDAAKHLNHQVRGSPKFYQNDGTVLVDVKKAWKTGWRQCEMGGYVGPALDTGLEVPCAA